MDSFERAGYGIGQVGFGRRPAVVVVDFQLAFTSSGSPLGGGEHIVAAVERAAPVLSAARSVGTPVIHTYVAWSGEAEFGRWKIPSLLEITPGSWAAQIDPRVWGQTDLCLLKRYPSAFFGTDLSSILQRNDIDTVLVMGATTSGCVRATTIDAFSHGFRTQLVEDCCGDQSLESHDANLRDIGRRYADIIDSTVAMEWLASNRVCQKEAR
ncbi:isochorismatase family protein [Micromonospora sp. NPDC005806]|uniref:isochorismatase family protein n=1 Tax=Micromonospora sp. NPDC005806 TaxID=3364234 RepID=UPI00368E981C